MVVTRSHSRKAQATKSVKHVHWEDEEPVLSYQNAITLLLDGKTAEGADMGAELWPTLNNQQKSMIRLHVWRNMKKMPVAALSPVVYRTIFSPPPMPLCQNGVQLEESRYVTQLLSDVEQAHGWEERLERVVALFDFIILDRLILDRVVSRVWTSGHHFGLTVIAKYDEFCQHKEPKVKETLQQRYGDIIERVRPVKKRPAPSHPYNLRPRKQVKQVHCIACSAQ